MHWIDDKEAVLVTGSAGFIGFHVAKRLLSESVRVVGIDNLDDYYDVSLKEARTAELKRYSHFTFIKLNIAHRESLDEMFKVHNFGPIIHLAAQAGVRYSLANPQSYIDSNLIGFVNLMEAARRKQCPHVVFASSSSVYGANKKVPFSESDTVDHPVSLYAATKKSNELIAHAYSHLFDIPMTGLRFFTVYGPWGRPDMAIFKFAEAILAGKEIEVYNYGNLRRDFTYIDDIVEGVVRVLRNVPRPLSNPDEWSVARYRILNIGNNRPIELMRLIAIMEEALGKKAIIKMMPMQKGDVFETYADIELLSQSVGYRPTTTIEAGIAKFVDWYRDFNGLPAR